MNRLLLMCCLVLLVPAAKAVPDLSGIEARAPGPRSAPRGLDTFFPEERHVLLVVDAGTMRSQAFLHALARDGHPGLDTTVLLIGSGAQTAPLSVLPVAWEGVQVLQADARQARSLLRQDATVAVYGITSDRRIAWRRSGAPRATSTLVLQILEWLN
ncbi:MAG: hypothetical protein IPK97_18205 [Ahniella sp.]|nr:hypothetical protein [Ahniella sp.]